MQSLQKYEYHLDEKSGYAKLFQELKPLKVSDSQLKELTEKMIDYEWKCRDSEVFSYGLAIFGQYLAHDITFETTSKFRGYNIIGSFINERTINLDLDCLYGQWTQDFLYDKDNRSKLLLGKYYEDEKIGGCWYDLQRNCQDKALIPDARNDENIIVSQLQVLFIQFHNKMVDYLKDSCKKSDLFQEARRMVIWHYHWLIAHEYLYKMVDWEIFKDIMENGPKYYCHPTYLPLEFTGAAFRQGHSQTRENNRINEHTEKNLFALGAFETMDEYVDWHYLFDFQDGNVQYAKLIDTKIAKALHDIPFIPSGNKYERSLPFRNLRRGVVYGLPSGEDVARRMCFEPIDVPETKKLGLEGTPLWFYILKEAEVLGHEGEHLGPVGSTILGECFLSILRHDKYSYFVLDPKWKPVLGKEPGTFDFTDLIEFVGIKTKETKETAS